MDDDDTVSRLLENIDLVVDSGISQLPFQLFEKQGNRTTKLLANSGDGGTAEGRHRWYDYQFNQYTVVSRVLVTLSGYTESHEFEIKWLNAQGNEVTLSKRVVAGSLSIDINDVCQSISFRPPSVFFGDPTVLSVTVQGIEQENISIALDALSNLETYREDILKVVNRSLSLARQKDEKAKETEVNRLAVEREMKSQRDQVSRLKKNIGELSLNKSELIAQNAASESSLEDSTKRLNETKSDLARSSEISSSAKLEIIKQDATLRELRNNINLFPTEISSFVDQGTKNLWQYFWLAAAPISIIVIIFYLLINGSANLTNVVSENPNINLQALLVSRLPYVTISIAIITASYKISRAFMMQLIKINDQKLSLTKISIIAKEVSDSAEKTLNLTEEDIYRLRTDLKMQLLKDHLKDYLSKDFTIELPQQLIGYRFGIFKISKDDVRTGIISEAK